MNKRKINITDFGFTEEQWAALDEERKLHFRNRDAYQRNRDKRLKRQHEYYDRKKAEQQKGT